MKETPFNAALRGVLFAQGLQAVHVREADRPGALDLVVWDGIIMLGWIELKVDDEEVRPSQVEFVRGLKGTPAYVARYWNRDQFTVLSPFTTEILNPPDMLAIPDFRQFRWRPYLANRL